MLWSYIMLVSPLAHTYAHSELTLKVVCDPSSAEDYNAELPRRSMPTVTSMANPLGLKDLFLALGGLTRVPSSIFAEEVRKGSFMYIWAAVPNAQKAVADLTDLMPLKKAKQLLKKTKKQLRTLKAIKEKNDKEAVKLVEAAMRDMEKKEMKKAMRRSMRTATGRRAGMR